MRTGSQKISGEFKRGDCLLTLYCGEIIEKLVKRIPGGQVVQEILYRHPCSAKDWSAAKNLRVDLYDGIHRCHDDHRTPDLCGGEEAAEPPRNV